MSSTPILAIPEVATNQNQKETTINTAIAILEAAMNDNQSIDFSGGDVTLTSTEFNRNFLIRCTGQTQARVMSVPTNDRWFAVENAGAHNITVDIDGQAFAGITVEPGKTMLLVSDGTTIISVSQGISDIFSLSDVDGSQTPTTGQTLVWDGAQFIAGDIPADIHVDFRGTPAGDEVIYRRRFARQVTIPINFDSSQAEAGVAATAQTDFDVQVNGSSIGTISFAAAATAATFTAASSTTINVNDVLTIVAPTTPDASLADLSIALWAVYI